MAVKAAAASLSLKPNGIIKRADTNKWESFASKSRHGARRCEEHSGKGGRNEADMKSSDRDFSSFFFFPTQG